MNKWIALLLACAMLVVLTGCGSQSSASSSSEETPVVEEPEETTEPEPEPEETTEPEVEEAEPDPEPTYTNPLTGEAVESDISANRPIAVMLNTLKKALPQSGCASADILIEAPEEGGITRVMALYQDISGVGTIGTVRSTREYYVFLAMGFDALMSHAGGESGALQILEDEGYESLDFLKDSTAYWRDQYRLNNVGTEHSLYTSSENLLNYLDSHDSIRTTHETDFVSPYTFAEDGTPADGESAVNITVSFSSYKDTNFVYDETTGLYAVNIFGEPYIDENTGEQVTVTNVIIMPTTQTTKEGTAQRQKLDLSSGTGYYACGGEYIPITWEKGDIYEGDMYAPLVFTLEDGSQLDLGVGKTYICVCGSTRPITIE